MRYLSKDILEEVITQRPSDSYKSNFGRVVLIGGNRQYGGAIIMSTEACINSGAGLTTVITDVKNHGPLHARCPEAMVVGFEETVLLTDVVEQAEVILIGPGLGLDATAQQILKMVLAQHQKQQWLIIDGSAITLFSQGNFSLTYPEKVVFTPHQMEWQRLSHLPWLASLLGFWLSLSRQLKPLLAPFTYTVSLEMIWPKPTMLFYQRRLVKPCRHI